MFPELSRSRLAGLARAGHVTVDGAKREPKDRVWGGERIELDAGPHAGTEGSALASTAYRPEAIALSILYEDDSIAVVDKPAGLVVHPGSGNWAGTLANALLHHAPVLQEVPRAGIVHRLDKDTSGLLVVAKTVEAHTSLVRQLQARTVARDYLALVNGRVSGDGEIEAPVGRDPRRRTRMAVVASGKFARTRYRVIERLGELTLLECSLDTGRTHQIRVHMAQIGHALVGDPVYGAVRSRRPLPVALRRQALHARRLALIHPATARSMQWESPVPHDIEALLRALRALRSQSA